MTTTTELHKEIRYDRITKDYAMRYEGQFIGCAPTYSQAETILNDYVYELLTHGGCETATALDGGQADDPTPPVDDGPDDNWGGFRQPRLGHAVIDQPRLTQHVVQLTNASVAELIRDDTYASLVVDGRTYPLVMIKFMHGRPEIETSLHAALAQVQDAIAVLDYDLTFAQQRLQVADDVPTENPDVDTTPETAGPSPLRRPSCLCVAEQTDIEHTPDAWRCRNPACLSVAKLDDFLTLSQLIARRESLAHIKVLVFARLACRNCGGPHRIQACPEIAQALLAAEATPVEYDTLEMVRLWSVSRTLLVAKLARLTRPQLLAQAVAFAAWLETRTHAGLKAASVLHIWEQMIEVDNGPAAPAMLMRVAA